MIAKITVKRDDKKSVTQSERIGVIDWLRSVGKLEPDTPPELKPFVDKEEVELGVRFGGVDYTAIVIHIFDNEPVEQREETA